MDEKIEAKEEQEVVEVAPEESQEFPGEDSGEKALEVLEAEKINVLIGLKNAIDDAEGPQIIFAIEAVIVAAAQWEMATKEVFEKIGFKPELAEVLERMTKGEAGLGDLDAVWEI